MLKKIKITNLALISKTEIEFNNGFNVLTGETGAGKSLIVDALLFLTGCRADKTLIKSGEEFARVEGVFEVDANNQQISEILNSVGLDNEGTIIISRYFSLSGKNECRINGEVVTLNIIKKLSNHIIDIFGQNDSISLLDSNNHLTLLDEMFKDKLYLKFQELELLLSRLNSINTSIKDLGGLDKDRENNIRLLQFQIDEINEANLFDGEEEDLKDKITRMQNTEKIYNAINQTLEIIDGEYNISNAIKSAINSLSLVDKFDSDIANEKDRLFSIKYDLEDVSSNINSILSKLTYSEEEFDILQDRLTLIKDLERKYGNTIKDVLETKEDMDKKLDILLNADDKLLELKNSKNKTLEEILSVCVSLHEIRVKEIGEFRFKFVDTLKELGMSNANFDVVFLNEFNIDNIESLVTNSGADKIEFMFSANLGYELRPLSKIISGGEMSRFMLGFKSLQNLHSNKTCIFDEIDTGIGGEIGNVIGKKICDISRTLQVICITHLAQIACFGDTNYKIEKFDEDGITKTSVCVLNDKDKVNEIARMLGNSTNITSIHHSQEIINEANSYKLKINL